MKYEEIKFAPTRKKLIRELLKREVFLRQLYLKFHRTNLRVF